MRNGDCLGKQQKLKQERARQRAAAAQAASGVDTNVTLAAQPQLRSAVPADTAFPGAARISPNCTYNPQRHVPTEPYIEAPSVARNEDIQVLAYTPSVGPWVDGKEHAALVVTNPASSVEFGESWLQVNQIPAESPVTAPTKEEAGTQPESVGQTEVETNDLHALPNQDNPAPVDTDVVPPTPAVQPPVVPTSTVAAHDLAEYLSIDPPTPPSTVTDKDVQALLTTESDIEVLRAIENGDINAAYDAIVSRRSTHAALAVSVQASLAAHRIDQTELQARVDEALVAQDALRVESLVRRYDAAVWDLSQEISLIRQTANHARSELQQALSVWHTATNVDTLSGLRVRLVTNEHMLRASPSLPFVEELASALETAQTCLSAAEQAARTVEIHESTLIELNQLAQDINRRVHQTHNNLQQLSVSCEQFGFPFPETIREQQRSALERAVRLMRSPVSILAGMASDRTTPVILQEIAGAMERRLTLVREMRAQLAHPPKSDNDIRRMVFLFFAAIVEGARKGCGLRMAGMTLVRMNLLTEPERSRVNAVMESQRRFFSIRNLGRIGSKKKKEMWCPLPETLDIGKAVLLEVASPSDTLKQALRDALAAVKEETSELARERAATRKKAAGAEGQSTDDGEDEDDS